MKVDFFPKGLFAHLPVTRVFRERKKNATVDSPVRRRTHGSPIATLERPGYFPPQCASAAAFPAQSRGQQFVYQTFNYLKYAGLRSITAIAQKNCSEIVVIIGNSMLRMKKLKCFKATGDTHSQFCKTWCCSLLQILC